MNATEIRQSFLDFFRQHSHAIVPSDSVVPHDDPTLLFTNAGMNQFKPYFLGQATPDSRRVADTQKCIRVSGKHNDLEEVGHDTYHHTFFEMLGNWSFGDYYKRDAIAWAWDLLTRVWGLPKERLYATVFGGDEAAQLPADEEAERLWAEVTDIDPTHILRFGRKDNFWMMGDVGPCGPCSEIHIDLTPDLSGGPLVNVGSPLAMELWNLVFIQYNSEGGDPPRLKPLPATHVDTGAGLERIAAVMECTDGGKTFGRDISNYDTALFRPIIAALEEMSGRPYTPGLSMDEDSIAMRVVADHLRMTSFSIADGAIPSNEGRGYVVRRILRRAARYGRKLGLTEPFLYRLVPVLAGVMGDVFPEIRREQGKVEQILRGEETSFNANLDRGIGLFEDEIARVAEGGVFPGEAAFKLYDTFGFPLDLTMVMAGERGMAVDEERFHALMKEQKERARSARVSVAQVAEGEDLKLGATPFVGFDSLEDETAVVATLGKGDELAVVLEETPFYAEMGGQVGDTGQLIVSEDSLGVADTRKREGVILHRLAPGGRALEPGEKVRARVDRARRLRVQRHHTATHLLHYALRDILGDTVRQQGSLVTPERLRFDFTYPEAVGAEKLRAVERLINERVLENDGISWFEIPYAAKPPEVIAFFGDKYGDKVRVVKVGGSGVGRLEEPVFDGFSMELCGGTHSLRTGEIGLFRFVSEGAIAAGVRRVEAVVGEAAEDSVRRDLELLDRASSRLNTTPGELEKRLEALLETQKRLERELAEARKASAVSQVADLLKSRQDVDGVPVIVAQVGDGDADFLRQLADGIRSGGFEGVALLAGIAGEKVGLLTLVTPEFVKQGHHAGNLVKQIAKELGGGGGGRPDLAQAGAKDASRLPEVLKSVPEMIRASRRS